MFNRFAIKLGLYNGEYIENNQKITGKYILGINISNIKIETSDYIYEGPYIPNSCMHIGKLITDEFKYNGKILNIDNKLYRNGNGITTYNDGEIHTGNYFHDDFLEGKIVKLNGEILEGTFLLGEFNKGYHILKNGDKITGNFLISISGKMERINGDVFEGKFHNFDYQEGILTKDNGDIYQGEWYNGKLNSQNIFIEYSNGDSFVGSMKNDKYCIGILKKDGYIFNGHWFSDRFNGVINYPNGEIYKGSYYNNMRNGNGLLITKDIIYECNWINNIKFGKGYKSINGNKIKVFWKNNMEINE